MNTTLNCSFVLPLYDSMISVIQPEMTGQVTKWGGSFSAWKANADAFRAELVARCAAMNQGMIDCYSLTGPYNITVKVSPAGAGDAKVNSITPSSYTFFATYFGGMNTLFRATANPGYVFDHWEFNSHTPSPSNSSDSIAVSFTGPDDVVAVFRSPEEPAGGQVAAVPNAFSPNGDGNNDVLYVLGTVLNMDFVVYNRWGQQVFKTSDRSQGWDGTFNGVEQNSGVFAYRLTGVLPNGERVEKKGNITLVR
jgi:gliding motility-associated-like protein